MLASAVPAMLLALSASAESKSRAMTDYWELTRTSTVVLVGTVARADSLVSVSVARVLKGGVEVGATVEFPAPPLPAVSAHVEVCGAPRVLKFETGESWLLFLRGTGPRYELLGGAKGELLGKVEQAARNVLLLDSLPDDRSKCEMLVRLMSPPRPLSGYLAARELEKYNRPEFLNLMEPLAHDPYARSVYIGMLRGNTNPRATDVLRGFLKSERDRFLESTVLALRGKEPEDAGLSRELLVFLEHEEPRVRRAAIRALRYRNYGDASVEILKRLDDPDAGVRSAALRWPWYRSKEPLAMRKVRRLTNDADENVREAAYGVLRSGCEVRYFYTLLFASLFDRSRMVRRRAGMLDVLWERRPFATTTLMLWPSVLVVALVFWVGKRFRLHHPLKASTWGIALGYVAGALCGYWIGVFQSRTLFCTVILIPPLFMPLGVLLLALTYVYGRKHVAAVAVPTAVLLSAATGIATWSFAVWPGIFGGFSILIVATMLLIPGLSLGSAACARD